MFQPGQRVVCINDAWGFTAGLSAPKKGSLYTVERVIFVEEVQLPFITVCELPSYNIMTDLGQTTVYWLAPNFRIPEERKTDIAIFTEMLNPTRILEKV